MIHLKQATHLLKILPPPPKKRPNVVVNKYPERDTVRRAVPGNSTHANINQRKKILLLSDSILGHIKIRKFNRDLLNGHAYKKYFPGAKPSEIAYYCIPILEKELMLLSYMPAQTVFMMRM